MASTSAPRNNAAYGRIASASSTLYSENQTLITKIRKAMNMMKEIAVDFERDNISQVVCEELIPYKSLRIYLMKVKELDDGFLELLKASDDCTHLSNAMQSVGNEYQPGAEGQPTNFSKLFDDKIRSLKAASSSAPENHPWLRPFREAIWNVHHAGQVMPGDEQEDIVMTSTECNILNPLCPLTGKPVIELQEPVRSVDCKHIYEKKPIMQYIRSKASHGKCPATGCPKTLRANRVVCDPLLLIEIDEMRSMSKQSAQAHVVEDFTRLDEE